MGTLRGVNPDLDRERRKAKIDVESVAVILYGDLLEKKRAAGLLFVKAINVFKYCRNAITQ